MAKIFVFAKRRRKSENRRRNPASRCDPTTNRKLAYMNPFHLDERKNEKHSGQKKNGICAPTPRNCERPAASGGRRLGRFGGSRHCPPTMPPTIYSHMSDQFCDTFPYRYITPPHPTCFIAITCKNTPFAV